MCEVIDTIKWPTPADIEDHYDRDELKKELKRYSDFDMLVEFVSILQSKSWDAGYFYCREVLKGKNK